MRYDSGWRITYEKILAFFYVGLVDCLMLFNFFQGDDKG